MSNIEYLFDRSGNWIAFKIGKYLYNTDSKWVGWFPWDGIAVDTEGKYLGSIYLEDRLLVDLSIHYVPYPGYPGYPGYRGYCGYISNTADINTNRLKGE